MMTILIPAEDQEPKKYKQAQQIEMVIKNTKAVNISVKNALILVSVPKAKSISRW